MHHFVQHNFACSHLVVHPSVFALVAVIIARQRKAESRIFNLMFQTNTFVCLGQMLFVCFVSVC